MTYEKERHYVGISLQCTWASECVYTYVKDLYSICRFRFNTMQHFNCTWVSFFNCVFYNRLNWQKKNVPASKFSSQVLILVCDACMFLCVCVCVWGTWRSWQEFGWINYSVSCSHFLVSLTLTDDALVNIQHSELWLLQLRKLWLGMLTTEQLRWIFF